MATKKATPRPWRCRKCKAEHSNRRLRICPNCKTRRLAKKHRGHMKALDLPSEIYVELNMGEDCGICGRRKNPVRNHDRDHDHRTGQPRGLLCPGRMGCNRRLGRVDDIAWLKAAVAYLERAEEWRGKELEL